MKLTRSYSGRIEVKASLGVFDHAFTGGAPSLRNDLLEMSNFASGDGIVTQVVSDGIIDR
jgi:hypothetical protein